MKARKVILTLELLTDVPKNIFNRAALQQLFYSFGLDIEGRDTQLEIQHVTFQVVKGDK